MYIYIYIYIYFFFLGAESLQVDWNLSQGLRLIAHDWPKKRPRFETHSHHQAINPIETLKCFKKNVVNMLNHHL